MLCALFVSLALQSGTSAAFDETRASARPNVVLVVVSGLRADSVGGTGSAPPPALDAFAAGAVRFSNAWTHAPDVAGSFASLWSSTHVCRHGVVPRPKGQPKGFMPSALPEDLPNVAQLFRDAGYLTVAYADGGEITEQRGFRRGFEYWDSQFRGIRERMENVLDFIATRPRDRPYLLLVQTNDMQMPYRSDRALVEQLADPDYDGPARKAWRQVLRSRPHPKINNPVAAVRRSYNQLFARGELDEADRAFFGALYGAALLTVDHELARMFTYLERLGELDETILVVVGSQGTAFWEHGTFGYETLHEENLRVPLLMRVPETEPREVSAPVGLVDVLPTLCALCGIETPATAVGEDLFAERTREASFAQAGGRTAVRFGTKKALVEGGAAQVLYDLAADPGETNPIDDARALERAREYVEAQRAACRAAAVDPESPR